MKRIKLSDIIITEAFANSHPSVEKVQKYEKQFVENGKQVKSIVLNKYNMLVDGYIQYLILKENGIEEAEYIRSSKRHCNNYRYENTTYIFGKHPNCDKEFVWRIPKYSKEWNVFKNNIQVGNKIFCYTKYGVKPVIVTRVEELKECPTNLRVKKVAKCNRE